MREIKFRVWNIEKDEVRDGVIYNKSWLYYCQENEIFTCSENYILMQYTGLKDKNNTGTEIYFDDIVHIYGYGDLHIKDMGDVCQLYEAIAEGDIGEIKGNIYENPNLLKNE